MTKKNVPKILETIKFKKGTKGTYTFPMTFVAERKSERNSKFSSALGMYCICQPVTY